ncbi:patatin-like phospholipase family protein [Occultella gossypii]|uniref:Patatin-like phospholipase family protein n=1 Tax=Occultella gossypii TaxID=2800820 RepID=A0ABS7SBN9_9MICO|nr:patatin-like phospholipase family protein [Occultella gossypii]MBZ2197774.1 patatin-like phospholipase family protein [Occultella gossypii]
MGTPAALLRSARHGLIRLLGGVPASPTAGIGPDRASGPLSEAANAPRPGPGTAEAEVEPLVGLVLGGGGARSSFEIGALSYLYEVERITPSVITGTSAGSVLAGILAQHGDLAGQQRTVAELRRIWLGMTTSSDMFAELPWFTALREDMPTWRRLAAIQERAANRVSLVENLSTVLAGPRRAVDRLTERARMAAENRAGAGQVTAATDRAGAGQVAAATDRPGVDRAADGDAATTAVPGATEYVPPEHDPASAGSSPLELLSALWDVGRTGPDVNVVLRGAARERSAFVVGPIIDQLLDPAVFDTGLPATSGVELRLATVHLESGELRYVDGAGRLRDAADQLLDENPVALDQAILASCAIPAGLPPVRLNEGTYVDGGVRENVPVEIAYSHLGVERCYVVTANPVGLPPAEDFHGKPLLEIVMRAAAEIMPDEIQANEVEQARALGATVIDPELDIHDIITIEPGLIAIAMDYGYLRAADVCADATEAEHARTRDVINLRRLIWSVEDDMFAGPKPATAPGAPTASLGTAVDPGSGEPAQLEPALAELKYGLRDLVAQVPPERLPPGARDWWRTWERHTTPITATPDWLDTDPASSPTLES